MFAKGEFICSNMSAVKLATGDSTHADIICQMVFQHRTYPTIFNPSKPTNKMRSWTGVGGLRNMTWHDLRLLDMTDVTLISEMDAHKIMCGAPITPFFMKF